MVMMVLSVDGEVSCREYDADVPGVPVQLMHDAFSGFGGFAEEGYSDFAFGNLNNSAKFPDYILLAVTSVSVCE